MKFYAFLSVSMHFYAFLWPLYHASMRRWRPFFVKHMPFFARIPRQTGNEEKKEEMKDKKSSYTPPVRRDEWPPDGSQDPRP
jgi:hypothetical protein